MRYIFALFLVSFFFLASCRVDEFSPCDEVAGMDGMLCKEFRSENNISIGYLAYYYNSDKQLTRKEYKSTEGHLKKYDAFEYEENKLSKERSFDEDGKLLQEIKYTYNEAENISNVYNSENGVDVLCKSFEYSDTLLLKESNFAHNQLEDFTLYQYYEGESKVYRKSLYSASGELLSYINIEYFVNNHVRYNHYAGNHVFTGYDVSDYNGYNNIINFSTYDFSGKLILRTEYLYNHAEQLDITNEYDEGGILRKQNKFIYQ